MKKVLLIRLDKIGDLISTLCVDQGSFMTGLQSHWVIAQGLGFVPELSQPQREYLELSKDHWQESMKILRNFIRQYQPDVAVSFQAPWWVNAALWLEGVPVRAGVLSQWHSFLFLNRGLRQRRSQAVQHEADYNFDLLKHALGVESSESTPILQLVAPDNPELLNKHGLQQNNYIVVHPGMAGSALNWPVGNYISLIEKVIKTTSVALTGTINDEPWLKDIKQRFHDEPRVHNLQSLLKPGELLTILKNAKAVVVPSTGVAHMAASLGVPVLGLYSPLRVQHPKRWAARGPRSTHFVPTSYNENCMAEILVDDLLKKLKSL